MKVYVIHSDLLEENTYLLVEESKALVIDPGVPAEVILRECDQLGVEPIAVLLTHGHADHIRGAAGLQEKGLKVYAHAEEFEVIAGRANLALALGLSLPPFTPDVALKGGEILAIGPFRAEVIFTPGHTQGGVSYLVEGALFTGDSLFHRSYGRTDFPTGDEQDLLCSLANELFELPPETPVYAGHSDCVAETFVTLPATPDTTIGAERVINPILDLL